MRFLSETEDELTRYLTNDRWFQLKGSSPLRLVGYFSPEFGIAEALPQYSGGLGVLAGDHLKAASDLGVPLVGVGLFYRHGYFRQSLSHDGWQQERYPDLDPYAMALTLCEGVRVERRPRRATAARPGVACRRRPHTALPARRRHRRERARHRARSPTASTAATSSIGCGRRSSSASAACACSRRSGIDAQVFHTNEGHAGFLGLERIRTG